MSSRERLQAALASKPTDRVAWSPCVDGYFLSSLPEDEKLDEAGLHRAIGSDALLRHVMVFTSTGPTLGLRSRPADNPRIEVRAASTPRPRPRLAPRICAATCTICSTRCGPKPAASTASSSERATRCRRTHPCQTSTPSQRRSGTTRWIEKGPGPPGRD